MKKIHLFDTTEAEVYSDSYGRVTSEIRVEISGELVTPEREKYFGPWTKTTIGIKEGDGVKSIQELHPSNRRLVEMDVAKDVYVMCGGLWYPASDIARRRVRFFWDRGTFVQEIKKNADITVYEGVETEIWVKPWEIKEGLRVCLNDRSGTYVVTKVYERPNAEALWCDIERLIKDGTEPMTLQNGLRLYFVLYDGGDELLAARRKSMDVFSVFNQPLAEEALAPFAERGAHVLPNMERVEDPIANIYWQPIPNASGYVVSLYKYRKEEVEHMMYLLEKIAVDRNTHWLTLDHLFGEGYIVLLEAEDREGNVVARSRGIDMKGGKVKWYLQ